MFSSCFTGVFFRLSPLTFYTLLLFFALDTHRDRNKERKKRKGQRQRTVFTSPKESLLHIARIIGMKSMVKDQIFSTVKFVKWRACTRCKMIGTLGRLSFTRSVYSLLVLTCTTSLSVWCCEHEWLRNVCSQWLTAAGPSSSLSLSALKVFPSTCYSFCSSCLLPPFGLHIPPFEHESARNLNRPILVGLRRNNNNNKDKQTRTQKQKKAGGEKNGKGTGKSMSKEKEINGQSRRERKAPKHTETH